VSERLGARSPWWDAAAQVVVTSLEEPELDPEDHHHLGRVLRLRPGATVCATDGTGGWRPCTFTGAAVLEPAGSTHHEPFPDRPVTVGFALVKGSRPELVVQKLTELGVDRIFAFAAARSVVRWDPERTERNRHRLRRVAREACGQSRRLHLPQVDLCELAPLVGAPGVVAAEPGGRALGPQDHTVIVGPEGGWAEGEVAGCEAVTLGPNVLRAETAAILAGGLLISIREGLLGAQDPS
jgi:16S rRNA (uracil1498-N3)-methyltransferase